EHGALGPAGRARPHRLPRSGAGGDAWAHAVSADRRSALPAHLVLLRFLLVPPHARRDGPAVARGATRPRGPARARTVRWLEQLLPRPRGAMAHRRCGAHACKPRAGGAAAISRPPALVRPQGTAERPCTAPRSCRAAG